MVYTMSIDTMKCWDQHTKKIKYFLSAKFDGHKNKYGIGWSLGSELMFGTHTSTLLKLKIDLSYNPFIKYNIFEVNISLPSRGTPICFQGKKKLISYCTCCAGEVDWTLPIPLMAFSWLERIFKSSQSQGWWFAFHNFFRINSESIDIFLIVTWSN